MTEIESDKKKKGVYIKGTGHSFPSFDTEEEAKKKVTDKVYKEDLAMLEFSYKRIFSYSQLIGGKIINTYSIENSKDFTEDRLLFMEKNMSMIHSFAFRENGKKYRIYSQMIRTVDKIRYKL